MIDGFTYVPPEPGFTKPRKIDLKKVSPALVKFIAKQLKRAGVYSESSLNRAVWAWHVAAFKAMRLQVAPVTFVTTDDTGHLVGLAMTPHGESFDDTEKVTAFLRSKLTVH